MIGQLKSRNIVHQQLKGLFNCYDIKNYPNMNTQLQESHIQLVGLDGEIQEIFQDKLRSIWQNTKNSKNNVEIFEKEKVYEILDSFLVWRWYKK